MTSAGSMLYRYLLGAMQQIQLTMTVRALCTDEEVGRLPQIIEAWRKASHRMQELLQNDAGAADKMRAMDPPSNIELALTKIAADPLFQASFSIVPTCFKMIEIDYLVAPQREVNMDYVESLRQRLSSKRLEDIVDFCLATRTEPPPIKHMQTAQNQMTFSSPSLDLRFLGGYPKPLSKDDVSVAHQGGQPVMVVALLVGFGAAPINAWHVGSRYVLNNGFHRIVALRSEGITHIPAVVQEATNPDIEFPDHILGLSRSYLLQHPRPVLVKDFFDDSLKIELRLKPRMKTLKVIWGPEEGIVPVD